MTGQGRPTATVEVRDMSGPRRRASAAPASPEKVLFRAYGAETGPGDVAMFRVGKEAACACGGVIRVTAKAIQASIDVHNATPKHVAWRVWREM